MQVKYIGYYDTEEEAARAYDRAILRIKPGAQINFPAADYPTEHAAGLAAAAQVGRTQAPPPGHAPGAGRATVCQATGWIARTCALPEACTTLVVSLLKPAGGIMCLPNGIVLPCGAESHFLRREIVRQSPQAAAAPAAAGMPPLPTAAGPEARHETAGAAGSAGAEQQRGAAAAGAPVLAPARKLAAGTHSCGTAAAGLPSGRRGAAELPVSPGHEPVQGRVLVRALQEVARAAVARQQGALPELREAAGKGLGLHMDVQQTSTSCCLFCWTLLGSARLLAMPMTRWSFIPDATAERLSPHAQVLHIGFFEFEEDAARAYDKAAVAIRGPRRARQLPGQRARPNPGAAPLAAPCQCIGKSMVVSFSRRLSSSRVDQGLCTAGKTGSQEANPQRACKSVVVKPIRADALSVRVAIVVQEAV